MTCRIVPILNIDWKLNVIVSPKGHLSGISDVQNTNQECASDIVKFPVNVKTFNG